VQRREPPKPALNRAPAEPATDPAAVFVIFRAAAEHPSEGSLWPERNAVVQEGPEQLKARVRDYVERIWNRKELDALDELASVDYRRHLGPSEPSIDRNSQKLRLQSLQRALPDVQFSIEDLIAEGDRVVFRVTVRATQRGDLFGVAATGKAVAFSAIDILRFERGLIVEHWGFGDSAALLRQLGRIPG
jgi:ketosteroid isomerase-like protein